MVSPPAVRVGPGRPQVGGGEGVGSGAQRGSQRPPSGARGPWWSGFAMAVGAFGLRLACVGCVPSYELQAGRGQVAMGMPPRMGAGVAAHAYVVDVIGT